MAGLVDNSQAQGECRVKLAEAAMNCKSGLPSQSCCEVT